MESKQYSRIGSLLVTLLAACGLIASSAMAEITAEKPAVKESRGVDGISWQTATAYKDARLTISGPDGFRMEQSFQPGDSLFLDFAAVARTGSRNGQYNYELTFSPLLKAADRALAEEARALGEDVDFLAQRTIGTVSGGFMLANGNIVDRDLPETMLKDIVHLDDVIIDGSLCVGFDCVNGESFGFDTIRLKENNLRIHFHDTSSSASFPDNQWRIVINDTSNGGAEYFAVEDSSAGRQVFRVAAGAPANALTVDSAGDVGIGTLNAVVDLHVVSGNTPTLRLEQNGTSGFTPQTWDVAGNEAGFFIRDATNGSQLALRIRPGADSSSIDIGADNQVGVGTSSPDAPLDVLASSTSIGAGNVVGKFANPNGAVAFQLDANDNGTFWNVSAASDDSFVINRNAGTGNTEFSLKESTGNMTIGGTCIQFAGPVRCTASAGAFTCIAGSCP